MNAAAAAVALTGTPRFIEHQPDAFARPFRTVRVSARLRAPVIVGHSQALVQLVLTPSPDRTPEFAADKIDPQSVRLAGATPVESRLDR